MKVSPSENPQTGIDQREAGEKVPPICVRDGKCGTADLRLASRRERADRENPDRREA